jgi:hypothetical protein
MTCTRTASLVGQIVILAAIMPINTSRADDAVPSLSREQASAFARLALANIQREYPNKPEHVLNGPADILGPKAIHPAFYGSYDWHSCVHGHWMLVRLLRRFPDLPERAEVRAILDKHLSAENVRAESEYFAKPNRQSFERPYGWAWLLKLSEELHDWDDPDARRWTKNIQPLADLIVGRYISYFPKQTYPIRVSTHANTAFGLTFAHDYARAVGNRTLQSLVEERARTYFAKDADIPAAWEPGGNDFLSPALAEADLMRRVLPPAEFAAWFHRFLPTAAKGEPKALFEPATVTDRTDPQLVHLDGLNLSRAWALRAVAAALPPNDLARNGLIESAKHHADAALSHVTGGEYVGEHWLATFAVYGLTGSAGGR